MSKILLKLSSIVAFVTAGIYLFIFVVVHLAIPYNYISNNFYDYKCILIIGALSLVIAFGGILFNHYKELPYNKIIKKKNYILAWSIFLTIVTGLPGILGLAAYVGLTEEKPGDGKVIYIEEIKKLDELRKEGLITEEEFALKKKKILDL
ncbi:MAG: SHOCT domain-containing protein [Bacilli bacterium]|nr:SHOCT domain-containing protein [Bacilli bacterium]MDD3305191.1 SHOCT domain-containing protein [Bacilli bacterium]MDD4053238.1 SHOCT domain-containing protein [Bacilli bacterium]MDD4411238.1 SHOCT domain-containing protein [Bacilli bacterium]